MTCKPLGLLAISSALLATAGCGGGPDHPETYPVTGVVTQGGKPVAGADVNFIPTNQEGDSHSARARTDDSGRYELHTFFSAAADVPGAVPGEYKVTLFKSPATGGPGAHDPNWRPGSREAYMASRTPKNELPEKYSGPQTSPLTYTVKDSDNTFDIPIE